MLLFSTAKALNTDLVLINSKKNVFENSAIQCNEKTLRCGDY